ncbi:MAG: hypothetical protein M3N25_03995, partial [Actinomycetota bacterium]|nr:hypothetical protein [Actinomycetota bacterium]
MRTGALGLAFTAFLMVLLLLFGGTASAAEGDTTASQGSSTNDSGGSGDVKTADAEATGTKSTTTPTQSAEVNGHNGGIVIVGQDATVSNSGTATATTGGNTATGNASGNTAGTDQAATGSGTGSGTDVANNTADTSNSSDGSASINTGDATATGNSSTTDVNQVANADTGGGLGGIVIIDQEADVMNSGSATATTGGNDATGNASSNDADSAQGAAANGSIANNSATTSNSSDGSADINTGSADATGNSSSTGVNQIANATVGGSLGGIVIVNQSANVSNTGTATAGTGGNTATGNQSNNQANTVQGAVSGAGPPSGTNIASNDGQASNLSGGNATITTGDATATGNHSDTNVTQSANASVNGPGIVIVNQDSNVTNGGIAVALTGGNDATGNASVNTAGTIQAADSNGEDAGTSVAANFGTSSNSSTGSADITSGNAEAIGNASTTNVTQSANVNTGGGVVLVDQDANVVNRGNARANSGGNTAVGNASVNDAATDQDAVAGDAGGTSVAGNFGEAVNTSDGSASIATGDATAIGNESTTNVVQVADTAAIGGAGLGPTEDPSLIDQEANVVNRGNARASSGGNTAVGNASVNTAVTVQNAVAGEGANNTVASNFGSASNKSNGSAAITTGDATAVGNASTTNVAQVADTDIDGAGFVLVDQEADVVNRGQARANSGGNIAVGNASRNRARNDQVAEAGDSDGNVVVANFASAKNISDGTAVIATGDATAIGNKSTTNVAQVADTDIDGAGFVLVDQEADVVNRGRARANSGGNIAVGNASRNQARNDQQANAVLDPVDADIEGNLVASNDGQVINTSDGTAGIATGDATAIGNHSTTNVAQVADADIDGAGFVLVDQEADVVNRGTARASTGGNTAVGNASVNVAINDQDAFLRVGPRRGLAADDVVVSNVATTANTSDGTAVIATGDATAIGNKSTTNVAQVADAAIDGAGFALVNQDADVVNRGRARANSGGNTAVGNASVNVAINDQDAFVRVGPRRGLVAEKVVVSNIATTANTSDGSATIVTDCACAIGNHSTTNVAQVADADIDGAGFVLVNQDADVVNRGRARANSGGNTAVGNASFNLATND